MSATRIPDHADQAVSLLLSQDQDDPGTVGLVRALMSGVQAAEDDIAALNNALNINTATGAILDRLGAWVSEPRGASPDGEYRRAILLKLYAITGSGLEVEAIHIAETLTDPSTVTTWAMPPNGLQIQVLTDLALSATVTSRLGRFLEIVRPTGRALHGIQTVTGNFGFSDDPTSQGFDTGAPLAERIP